MARKRLLEAHPHTQKVEKIAALCEELGVTITPNYNGEIQFNFEDDGRCFQYRDTEGGPATDFPPCFESYLSYDIDE